MSTPSSYSVVVPFATPGVQAPPASTRVVHPGFAERGQVRAVSAIHAILVIQRMHSIDADQQDPPDAITLVDVLGMRLRRND